MVSAVDTNKYFLIVGMGATGVSIARYLQARGHAFHFFDTRSNPPQAAAIARRFPEALQFTGEIDSRWWREAKEIYLSPGVSRKTPVVQEAIDRGITISSDVGLFLREISAPVLAITGSNGKSTVTTMVGQMLQAQGWKVGVGGNIGTPVMDLLEQPADYYVLELSSFQLESLSAPKFAVACFLNLSADHMDRYDSLEDYAAAKRRIFDGAEVAVCNLADAWTHPTLGFGGEKYGFGKKSESSTLAHEVLVDTQRGGIEFDGKPLVERSGLGAKGAHNMLNAAAALAMATAVGADLNFCRHALAEFRGLPHRCEWVGEFRGRSFINDSKATNPGATLSAVKGLEKEFKGIVLIAGGDGKGADFRPLSTLATMLRAVVLLGQDAERLRRDAWPDISCQRVGTMAEAVDAALAASVEGDLILLSPACASLDMFENFVERGDVFRRCVESLKGAA